MQDYGEKEQILIIFTICFLHFYSNFSYDSNFTFEDYFNQNLINLCTRYKVYIKDIKQFKIFCYSFYYQLIKELKNIDYARFKKLYIYYNPAVLEEEKLIPEFKKDENFNSANNICNLFKGYLNYFSKLEKNNIDEFKTNIQHLVNKKIVTPLISTTERVVDMVLSVRIIKYFII
jgi:hypothetical protein